MPHTSHPEHSWFGPAAIEPAATARDETEEFGRLWQAFMTARLTLGLVLLVLQAGLYISNLSQSRGLVGICAAYFMGTLLARFFLRPRHLGQAFNRAWGVLVGLDIAVFSALQWLQGNNLNYTPLFALPILLASVLGTMRLALGTAAGVSMLLLAGTYWTHGEAPGEATQAFVQSALAGAGYFLIALLANQLATRLATEGQRAKLSQLAVSIQRQVNELVIEALPDGVLIVDAQGWVRAANPAARQLLGDGGANVQSALFDLKSNAAWHGLLQLTRMSIGTGRPQNAELDIVQAGAGARKVLAKTSLAAPQGIAQDSLCVLFLQDQRELEARLRTEKMASMGRMSTAVAHEIRNPLAAIAQANALLDEDIDDPRLKRLTAMVSQNAKRLEKIVDDILNVSRVRGSNSTLLTQRIHLTQQIRRIAMDWAQQSGNAARLGLFLDTRDDVTIFDAEQLRQVMFNLLDNAQRYAGKRTNSIQVLNKVEGKIGRITVWSDGAPMDASVQRHLFEPFFSSESRSSGLGLYISRELCERHGATLTYLREASVVDGEICEGNAFTINLPLLDTTNPPDNAEAPWQTTLY